MDPANGRIIRVNGPLVDVELADRAAMHRLVDLGPDGLTSEIVAIRDGICTVQAYEYTGGLRPGYPAVLQSHPLSARLGPGLLGGVFDGLLRPLTGAPAWLAPGASNRIPDGRVWAFRPAVRVGQRVGPGDIVGRVLTGRTIEYRVLVPPSGGGTVDAVAPARDYPADAVVATVGGAPVPLTATWPVRVPRPCRERGSTGQPLHTGQRAIDVLFPIAKGSTAAVPGGFGTGKTVLLQQIAKWCDADVIVYVGCGERGNEMAEVVADLAELDDPRTGGRLADRTVVIANTSNMPMMAREASIYTGATVAEYFRDMGYHVVVIADSTSRWAEALREFASRSGMLPAEEGYPADLASSLAAFYERAAAVTTLGGATGSVTVIGAVSPPGGDLTEPVTANTERFVRCRWTLDRDLAYARHYPAISWSGSFSRDAAAIAAYHARAGDPDWPRRRARALAALAEADRLATLAELVGAGSLPGHERMALLTGRLLQQGLLQQSSLDANDAFCSAAKAAALVDAILVVGDECQALVAGGASATVVEELDFGPVLRAREEAGPDDPATVLARQAAMLDRLREAR